MIESRKTVKRRRRVRWGRVLLFFFLLILFVGVGVGAAYYVYDQYIATKSVGTDRQGKMSTETLKQRTNILLLGTDDGDNEYPDAPKRTDTMMLLSIDPDNKSARLISIPRDTRVMIPGHKGYDKVNAAYAYGGVDLAKKTVEGLLDTTVNYYVILDWQAFIKVIDIIGGVDLYVEHDMNYEDPYDNLAIHIKKGYQHLDGERAGEYVRFRTDEAGDIGRVQRQQRFMKAMNEQLFQIGTLFKVPGLASVVNQYIKTDMSFVTIVKVANSLKGVDKTGLAAEMIPGKFATIRGISYWLPDTDRVKSMLGSGVAAATKYN